MIELTKDYIENLKSIIEAKDDAKAQEVLHELYPADIAELYQELNLQEAIYLYLLMDGDKAADVLMELDEEDRHKLLKELPNELIAKRFVDNMETDDAVDLMRELDEDTQEEILSHIEDVEQAGDIVDLLKYDEDTAGGLMGTEMIVVNENWSMPKCIDEMRKQAEEMSEIYYVYVVDDDERLKGVLPLQKLITHPSVSKIKHVMKKDPISVRDSDSIEEVTETIEKYDLVALPVVDSIGRLVGRITIDDVMDEVREQHERDYQLASGISQDVETSDNVFTQTAARLPWLLIGMIGGLGNSVILGGFESRHLKPDLGCYLPQNLNTILIEEFSNALLMDGLSPKTVRDILVVLKAVLKHCRRQIGTNFPDIEVIYPKEHKKDMRVLNLEEQQRLVPPHNGDPFSVAHGSCGLAILLGLFYFLRRRFGSVEDDIFLVLIDGSDIGKDVHGFADHRILHRFEFGIVHERYPFGKILGVDAEYLLSLLVP